MGEKELQLLSILPFESTLLDLYHNNKDALEEFMCVLIQLDEVNVHHMIYTTSCEASQVMGLLAEFGPSKFFIPKEDIFEVSKILLPSIDQKSYLIDRMIEHHNTARPNRYIDLKKGKECILVLDEEPNSFKGAKCYTATIQIEPNLSYIAMLESIYKTLIFLDKDSKQRQANALRHLVKQQDNLFVEDQEMMSLNFKTRIVNMQSGITLGMVNFINKIEKYLCLVTVFRQLNEQTKVAMLKNIKEELAIIIRELYTSDDISSELLLELQTLRPLSFMGDNGDLIQWQKLSYDLCSCINRFFEKKLNKIISPDNQTFNSNNIIKRQQQIVLCKQELDNLSNGLLALYENDLSQHTHHAQLGQNKKFYWLVVDGDARKKQEALKLGMKLYEPLLKQVISEEKKFVEQYAFGLDKLRKLYEDKSNGIEAKKEEIYTQMGNRDSALREERDKINSASKKLAQNALFVSIVMPTQTQVAKRPALITPHGGYIASNVRFSVLRANPYIGTSSKNIGMLTQKAPQTVSTKKADLFELCRSGDLPRFASEVIAQLSVEYDSDDIATLLPLRLNFQSGYLFLLRGLVDGTYPAQDGHNYSVCLSPPIPLIANVKQNIGMYIAHTEKQVEKKVVFDELKSLLQKTDHYIKIVFLYQAMSEDRLCWLVAQVRLHKTDSDYEIELTTINPFGSGKFSEENYQVLCNTVAVGIKSIDPSAKVTFHNKETVFPIHKPEKFSSGPLAVEIITNLIKGTKSTEELATTLKAKESRRQQVAMVKVSLKETDSRRVRFLSRHLDIHQVNLPKKTLLETACQHGQVAIAGFLIDDMLVDVNYSQSGYHPIFSALRGAKIYPSRTNLICYLLQGTTDPSLGNSDSDRQGARLRKVVDNEGRTVLHVAVAHGGDESVQILVKWGTRHPGTVDLFIKNDKNKTALHDAICLSRYGRLHGVIRVLLRYGLGQPKPALDSLKDDKEAKQHVLTFVMGYFEEQAQRVQKITLRPTQKLQRSLSGSFSEMTFLRGRSGSFLGGLVNNMMSPRVSYEWKGKVAQYCAEHKITNLPTRGSELNALDEDGFAPIHVACVCGKPELLEHMLNVKVEASRVVDLNVVTSGVVKRKFEGKDDTPELNNTKLTPLHLAVLCQRKFPEFVTKLLAQGVQVTQDSNQSTALHYAVGRDSKFVELILAHLDKTNSLDVANLPDKEGITALRKALLLADKTMVMPFVNIGIWPSEFDIVFVESEINQKENRVEIKQTLWEILEFIKTRYQMQLPVASQQAPGLKSPR